MLNLRNLRIDVEYRIFQKIELKFCKKNKDILPQHNHYHIRTTEHTIAYKTPTKHVFPLWI